MARICLFFPPRRCSRVRFGYVKLLKPNASSAWVQVSPNQINRSANGVAYFTCVFLCLSKWICVRGQGALLWWMTVKMTRPSSWWLYEDLVNIIDCVYLNSLSMCVWFSFPFALSLSPMGSGCTFAIASALRPWVISAAQFLLNQGLPTARVGGWDAQGLLLSCAHFPLCSFVFPSFVPSFFHPSHHLKR